MDDSTFRAYTRDRNFLQSILPISDGLNLILQRIFEVEPKRRISLHELREFILFCPHLGQESVDTSLPPTPPYSPVEKLVDSSMISFGPGLDPVPNLDPLPVQQYPLSSGAQYNNTPQLSFAPIDYPTPPGSTNGSPRQNPYTYQAKPVPAPRGPFATQAGFIPSIQSWTRCSQFVPSLAHHVCWRNAAVF